MSLTLPAGMQINAPLQPGYETILTPEALELVAKLHRAFEPRRQELLKARVERQARIDAGEMPDFLPETKHVREGDWKLELCAGSGGWSDPRPGSPGEKDLPNTQLYNLASDIAEKTNLQSEKPEIVTKMTAQLGKIVSDGRSTPGAPQKNAETAEDGSSPQSLGRLRRGADRGPQPPH